MGGSQKLFLLLPLHSSIQKEYAMRVCDTVFARSVLGREDYLSLFRKVDFLADFCVAYTDDVIGYVAMYANDLQSETAYITLIAVRRRIRRPESEAHSSLGARAPQSGEGCDSCGWKWRKTIRPPAVFTSGTDSATRQGKRKVAFI